MEIKSLKKVVTLESMYFYDDGRNLVFDKCPNPQAHLTKPANPESDHSHTECRFYLDRLITPEMRGAKGRFVLTVDFVPEVP